jgi:twitching motility protein PilT
MNNQQQPRIEDLLEAVVKRNASDLHLQVGLPPMLRVDGALVAAVDSAALTEETIETLIFAVLDEEQKQILIKDKEFDFSFAFGDLGRFRVNAFHERGNLAAAFRLIPSKISTIEELGLPEVVGKFANYPRGLVLITGPTGSGKTSTLAAIIDKINHEKAQHIITIEDPIEYTHKSIKSVIVQREIHYDTYSFSVALRSALREDPDVVLIGEMRDLETISSAITIAETGHLVLATLHTNSASQSLDRMIDVFPPHQQPQIRSQLSNILMAIVSQRLIPSTRGGRIAAAEILIANSAVRNIIREGKTHQLEAVIQTGSDLGMQSMDKTLAALVHQGSVSYEEAKNYAVDINELNRMMRD